MHKLLSDCLTLQSFITKSIGFSQEVDMIIPELKWKQKRVFRNTEKIDSWQQPSDHDGYGRALGLNQRALALCFCRREAHKSRFIVIYFFFFSKNKSYVASQGFEKLDCDAMLHDVMVETKVFMPRTVYCPAFYLSIGSL